MEYAKPDELSDFPVVIQLPVQWGDQDALGHVNNTVYFRWFESARIAYLEHMELGDKRSPDGLGPILAAIDCNYRRQLKYPDTVLVAAEVSRIGRTSMTMRYKVWSTSQQAVAADGQSTVVVFDYGANKPHPVPDSMRRLIEQLEGKSLA